MQLTQLFKLCCYCGYVLNIINEKPKYSHNSSRMFSDLPKRGCFQSNQRSFYRKCQSVPSHLPICCAQLLHAWKIGLNVRMRLEKFCERFNAKFIKLIFNRRPGLQQKRRLPLGGEFTKDLIFTVCNRHHLNYRKRSD